MKTEKMEKRLLKVIGKLLWLLTHSEVRYLIRVEMGESAAYDTAVNEAHKLILEMNDLEP